MWPYSAWSAFLRTVALRHAHGSRSDRAVRCEGCLYLADEAACSA
ncbi:hypothetical protein STRIP9103_03429 [Streptomyces ipomoeae 91-03]|uniref:Uncharacterized protein n=1 Tax=Streptomyces ipomoeae 91-03 TaxID=698759 RepID=L1L050_9ACTN|nr:hypothetical protein STRIP9103_03429 [Streptomyces ipomoeae 91-03]